MRNTIGTKIITVILAPSLLIFGLLSAFIVYAASRSLTVWAELDLKSISEVNASDLKGRIRSVGISVQSAASVLDTLDAQAYNGRERAENVIKAMFENEYVQNAWLAYDPEAFDGRDSEYTSDYPGAPSGRFIRSYVMKDGQIVTAPDMDESTLDDADISPWYVKPRNSDRLYVDTNNDIPNIYDYGMGAAPICTMAIAAPVHRDGRVIGCVGADVRFDVNALNSGADEQAAVAVFYPNGRVFFSPDLAFADDSVETLGFTQAPSIRKAISEGDSLFLSKEYSVFFDADAFTYFQPVGAYGGENLYLYTAKLPSGVFNGMNSLFMMIGVIIAAVVLFILSMVIYFRRKISGPLRSLTMAADAISMGDLETEIPSFPHSKDEIGVLSRSLHRMVEQFRIYILRLEQTQDEKIIYSKLDDLMETGGVPEVMKGLSALICGHFHVDKATMVRVSEAGPRIISRYENGQEYIGAESPPDFLYHTQIAPMISGKKLLLMNAYIISEQDAEFLDEQTRFAGILPIREGHHLLGYAILESRNAKNPFSAIAESILRNISEALAGFIKTDEKRREELSIEKSEPDPEPESGEALEAVRDVNGLDSAAAIQMMGGMSDLYEQVLKLMTSMLPETIEKLDSCLAADLSEFAIEIHGLKGSLNNVGAYALGLEASRIEQEAKSGDHSLCAESYRAFKDTLTKFHLSLVKSLESEQGKSPGNVMELVGMLPEAEEAAAVRDCARALSLLRPMGALSFDPETDVLLCEALTALEAREAEKAREDITKLRERLAHWEGV